MLKNTILMTALIALLALSAQAQNSQTQTVAPNPTSLPGAESREYKSIGDVKLYLHVFRPTQQPKAEKVPAIVFFFGGGWNNGTVTQFAKHSEYLASRGMVAIVADYRVKSRHGVTPVECVADAKSAIRWVRVHAKEFGIDANRIVAAGGSAGGHLAAATAFTKTLDEKGEDLKIISVPNALALFNPVLDMSSVSSFNRGLGDKALEISPLHQLRPGAPPVIIFHGTADTTVPFKQAEDFCAAMKKQNSRCELKAYEGRTHGFFNVARSEEDYVSTLRSLDDFLISLGYLKGTPTLQRASK